MYCIIHVSLERLEISFELYVARYKRKNGKNICGITDAVTRMHIDIYSASRRKKESYTNAVTR